LRKEFADLSLAYPPNNLGALCQAQGQYAESEKLRRRSPAIRVGNLGPDHPHVARVLQNLAEIYRLEGRYAEAESLGLAALRAGN
jgi:tetratricopeptide (TPR) repeat protein